jgi:hypothetical protein
MFEIILGTPTGQEDQHGRMIHVGEIVKNDAGFIGPVVFANGALRVDIDGGAFLKYNSSLLYGDGKPKQFEIIEVQA